MLRPTLVLLAGTIALVPQSGRSPPIGSPWTSDTVRPGSEALALDRLQSYALERQLLLTRDDSTRPFGRQSERLITDTLGGNGALVHVLTFDTPNALTVDSSWIAPGTLQPIRMVSRNRNRTLVLEFAPGRVRATLTPATGSPKVKDYPLATPAFEWNMLPVALSALEFRDGQRFVLPVFSDRAAAIIYYSVEVSADSIPRASGRIAPMWRLRATPGADAPTATWWVSRRHHFLDQAQLSEPGTAILYTRTGL
jgi:hypothetical protein